MRLSATTKLWRRFVPSHSNYDPHPSQVVPFGRYGGGNLTGHPVGLIIVFGVLLVGLIGVPEFRVFLLFALPFAGLFGFILWLHHRSTFLRR
jgi:hypothetical protein